MLGKRMSGRKAKAYLTDGQYYADLEGHYLKGVMKGIETTEERFKPHIEEVCAQVQFAVDHMEKCNLLGEHCFTFPDGTTVWATGYEPEVNDD